MVNQNVINNSNIQNESRNNSIISYYKIKLKSLISSDVYEKVFLNADYYVLKNSIQIIFSSFQKYNFAKRIFFKTLNNICLESWPNADIYVSLDFKKYPNQVKYENNDSKTFDNFIEEDYNKIPYHIVRSISMHSDVEIIKSGSVVFLHSENSCGKTHLLQAAYNSYREISNKISYYTSEAFSSKFIELIRENRMFDFRKEILKNDILLIDDFQLFQGKKATLKELESILSEMINANKYVIIASSKSVENYSFLPDRLFNFIKSSFSVNIQGPSDKIKEFFFSKVMDVNSVGYKWILSQEFSCVRSIKSLSEKISAYKLIGNKRSISLSEVKDIFQDSFANTNAELLNYNLSESVQKIQSYIAKYCGISHADLISKKRAKRISVARSVAIYVVKKITDISYVDMGVYFGNRDHSTLVNSVKFIENFILEDIFIKDEIHSIISTLKSNKI